MSPSPCNICGGTEFRAGPGGRTTPGGPPRCSKCASLERHRALRRAFLAIPPSMLAWRRALQFAPDPSLEARWFSSFETSSYEGENSIDVRSIDRPSGSYDFLSLSQVLEFVPEDRAAFSELVRIGSERLIMHLTFASALTAEPVSRHFDAPQGAVGRYHDYGQDLELWFDTAAHGLSTLTGHVADPVTGDASCAFGFFCRDRSDAEALSAIFDTGFGDVDSSFRLQTVG
jgi:hypothetical protein